MLLRSMRKGFFSALFLGLLVAGAAGLMLSDWNGFFRNGVTTTDVAKVDGWAAALWQVRPDQLVLVALAPAAIHLLWQVATLVPADGENALRRFRSNRFAGLLVFAACFVVGTTAF